MPADKHQGTASVGNAFCDGALQEGKMATTDEYIQPNACARKDCHSHGAKGYIDCLSRRNEIIGKLKEDQHRVLYAASSKVLDVVGVVYGIKRLHQPFNTDKYFRLDIAAKIRKEIKALEDSKGRAICTPFTFIRSPAEVEFARLLFETDIEVIEYVKMCEGTIEIAWQKDKSDVIRRLKQKCEDRAGAMMAVLDCIKR